MPGASSQTAKRVVVVGAGIIGSSAAYYSALRGHQVTIIDREPRLRDGCSFGNAGMIVPSHFVPLAAPGMVAIGLKWMCNPESPFYIKPRLDPELLAWSWKFWRSSTVEHVRRSSPLLARMNLASRACFEELAGLPQAELGLAKRGLLMLCKTARALEEEAHLVEQARDLGLQARMLTAAETAALDPGIRMDIAGAVFFPQDCHLSPAGLMSTLDRELDQLGVERSWETELLGFARKDARLEAARTSRGDFAADEIIICGGAWTPLIARQLQLSIPMQAGRGYSLTLPAPRRLPQICSICSEARIAVTPIGSALRFGGTMEIAGIKETISSRRVRGIINAVPRYFPDFHPSDFDGIEPWAGLRPCSPDGLPYLGRPARFQNLIIASGHGMMGMSLGPITGKLVSELVSHEPPSIDLTLLSPDRWN